MMDVREKLIELLCNLPTPEFVIGTRRAGKKLITAGFIADHLIANGVTVQENVEISDELLKQLKNAPITICKEEPSIELVQEWISVDERLPENDVMVIGYTPCDGFMFVGYYHEEKKKVWRIITAMRSTKVITKKVTHWMPLPHPPKGE